MAYGYKSFDTESVDPGFGFPSRRMRPGVGGGYGVPGANPVQDPGMEEGEGPSTLDRILMGVGQGLAGGGVLPMLLQNFARDGEEDEEERFRRPGAASAYTPNF